MPAATHLLMAALCCALAAGAADAQSSGGARTLTVERRIRVAPSGARGSRYVYVPFDVPRGAARVSVSYDYAREGGANTLDLGVFDPRFGGSDADPRGFRGWSGGRRSEFFISRGEATPGYLPGPLPAGRWRVVLGLYKVAPAGIDVSLKIAVEMEEGRPNGHAHARRRAAVSSAARTTPPRAADEAPQTPPAPRQVARHGLPWWSGDLHMHTVHSDGDWTVPGLVSAAREGGLDFIFVTDHNTSSHHAEVARAGRDVRRPLVLRGEEITTYGGHANAWGLPAGRWVDFRVRPGDFAAMSRVAARAHQLGALISVNHPAASCGGCAWSYGEALKDFDAVEVWNGDWDETDESALKMWDGLLRRGLRPTAVASSDSHRPQNPVGRPTTRVAAAGLTKAALLSAIRSGRVYLTAEPAGPEVSFGAEPGKLGSPATLGARRTVGEEIRLGAPGTLLFYLNVRGAPTGSTLKLVSGDGVVRTLTAQGLLTEVFEVECEQDGYYRLEVRDRAGAMLALTNPIYVKVRARGQFKGRPARAGRP